ncbi:MAG: FkbM family methyltransferase, partial [Kofleriaceae bacterium]
RGRPFEARERELAGELLRAHHGEERAIVDVGAHVGLHALTWARRFPRAHVIAIEPSPVTCARLARNVARNHLAVEVREVALADHVGDGDLHVTDDDGYAGLSDTRRKPIRDLIAVQVTTLDTIAAELRLGLVKIDVEGHEAEVIAGGRRSLLRDRPVLVVEIYGGVASNPDPEGTVARICELGYTAHLLGPRGLERAGRDDDARYNYFFLPT